MLEDPHVREAIAERGVNVVLDNLGVSNDRLAEAVRPQLAAALDTPAAEAAWQQGLRAARDAVAEPSTDGAVVVDLAPVLDHARQPLLKSGLPLPTEAPTTKVTLVRSSGLEAANHWYQVLGPLAVPLLVVTGALLLLAILVAPRHAGMLAATGIGVAIAMVFLILVLGIGEGPATGLLDEAGAPPAFADALYQAFGGSLRTLAFWVLGGGAVAFVIGLIGSVISRPSAARRNTMGSAIAS